MKQIQDLEAKAQSLQLTIDRLTTNLAKTEDEGHKSKDKVRCFPKLSEIQKQFKNTFKLEKKKILLKILVSDI